MKKQTKFLVVLCMLLLLVGCAPKKKTVKKEKKKPNVEVNLDMTLSGEDEVSPDHNIWVISDNHFITRHLYEEGEAFGKILDTSSGKELLYQEEVYEAFIDLIKKEKPDVLLVSGDLTLNGEKESAQVLAKYFDQIRDQGTDVFVIPGNHDINDAWARTYYKTQAVLTERITTKDFQEIFAKDGYDQALCKDPESLSYVVAPFKDLWFLMIDSNMYNEVASETKPITNGRVKDETFAWMEKVVENASKNNATVIPVIHHNLMDHNEYVNEGYTVDNADKLQGFFVKHDMKVALSGHIHAQHIASKKVKEKELFDIVTGSFASCSHPIGKINIKDRILTYRSDNLDIEEWAERKNQQDLNLLFHEDYMTKIVKEDAVRSALHRLEEEDSEFTDTQKQTVSTFAGELGYRFFSGKSYVKPEDLKREKKALASNPAYLLLQQKPESDLTKYIDSIIFETKHNPLEISIPLHE